MVASIAQELLFVIPALTAGRDVCSEMSQGAHFWLTLANISGVVYLIIWIVINCLNTAMIVKFIFNRRSSPATQNSAATLRRDRQVTLLLLLISLTFSVLAIPDVIIIATTNTSGSFASVLLDYSYTMSKVKTTAQTLTAVCNCLFFVASGSSFRTQLMRFLRQCLKNSEIQNWVLIFS